MSTKSKILYSLLVCLLILVVLEQARMLKGYASRFTSATHTSAASKPMTGSLASTDRVERPISQWLPFIKFGETVHYHTHQHADGPGAFIETTATTRTSLWVIGLCSTAEYEELADKPFQAVYKKYQKR